MSTHVLRPWTDCVKLHDDVETGTLTEARFALDLGGVAAKDPNVPLVYRDASAFFGATHLTTGLRKLLGEVLGSLAGRTGFNRVLKLRSPFGGGKSHTLASLLHAARERSALAHIPEAVQLPDPGPVCVAVFDGEKVDARVGKMIDGGPTIQTMWGWLAWQIDPKRAYPLVEQHDKDRVAPGGDVIAEMLTKGANGRPVLILLDEFLKYVERSGAVAVLDSTLQRQTKDFFQSLTVEVAGSERAALVYSLTWSSREALDHVRLLEEINNLAARLDQLREPVGDDEVLPILQRRLLGATPSAASANAVADAYSATVTNMRKAQATSPGEKQDAEEAGLAFRTRLVSAYPFHPALIDVMRERWASIENFQRTRGALRFLAGCLRSLKKKGGAGAVLGPGDVPLGDMEVLHSVVNLLGLKNDYDAAFSADLTGVNARARHIDERRAREYPELASVRPATRLATIIFLHSFGGLKRDAKEASEPLPPGITENELLAAAVTPEFDSITASAVLAELRSNCLYLHHDGNRYCFKKDPNLTKLLEDTEQAVAREESQQSGQGPVKAHIRQLLDSRLAKQPVEVWPVESKHIPQDEPRFLIAYLSIDFADLTASEQQRIGKDFLYQYGEKPRLYRNGIGIAIPDPKQVEPLRRSVRYLLAIERIEGKKAEHRLTKDQLEELKERKRTWEAAAEGALRDLYPSVWLPRMEGGKPGLEKVERGGRPLLATGIHERITELLTAQGSPKVHTTVKPKKVCERMGLGEPMAEAGQSRLIVATKDVQDSFFGFIEPPRLMSLDALRASIATGITERQFGYYSGEAPKVGSDGKALVRRDKVHFGAKVAEDEIDFDTGYLLAPRAIPEQTSAGSIEDAPDSTTTDGGTPEGSSTGGTSGTVIDPGDVTKPHDPKALTLVFEGSRAQLFKAFPALANLADKSAGGKITIRIDACAAAATGFDPGWLRNAVEEPLDEADIRCRRG